MSEPQADYARCTCGHGKDEHRRTMLAGVEVPTWCGDGNCQCRQYREAATGTPTMLEPSR